MTNVNILVLMAVMLWCLLVTANLVQSFRVGRTMSSLLHSSQTEMAEIDKRQHRLMLGGSRNDSEQKVRQKLD